MDVCAALLKTVQEQPVSHLQVWQQAQKWLDGLVLEEAKVRLDVVERDYVVSKYPTEGEAAEESFIKIRRE
jgi:hypothetical protein